MSSPSRTLDGSFKEHPLWKLRKYTIANLFLAFLLTILFPNPPPLYIVLLISFLVILYDLASFIHSALISLGFKISLLEARVIAQETESVSASQQNVRAVVKDEEDKKWPSKLVTIADLLLSITHAIFFFMLFINTFDHYSWHHEEIILDAYLSLTFLSLSFLHGIAYRKEAAELQKTKRAKRVKEICNSLCSGDTVVGCERCARVVVVSNGSRGRKWRERIFGGDKWNSKGSDEESARLIRTPSTDDEGDCGFERLGNMEGGYGTLSESQELKHEAHVVKKKRSKRAIGEEWEGSSKGKGKGKERAVSEDVDTA